MRLKILSTQADLDAAPVFRYAPYAAQPVGPRLLLPRLQHVDGRAVAAQIACEYDDEFFLESQNLRVYLMMFRILGVAVDREKVSG